MVRFLAKNCSLEESKTCVLGPVRVFFLFFFDKFLVQNLLQIKMLIVIESWNRGYIKISNYSIVRNFSGPVIKYNHK